ncbi:MAG: hypothetical protein GF329_18410 [Candidatus Lokiarchaeota archaeon]|nr:hypothetical protein [Candidatus Lokiarchaeota archaeon]
MRILSTLAQATGKYILNFLEQGDCDPYKTQVELLNKIIKHNSTTAFGKKHNFNEIRSIRDFQNNCKVIDYNYLAPYVQATIDGNDTALTNSKILYWGQTSGTSGKPKLIPVTKHVIDTYNSVSFRIVLNYIKEYPDRAGFLDGKWFLLPSFPLLRYEKDGRPVGFITGIIVHPFGIYYYKHFIKYFYYYPLKFLAINDAETRFKKIAEDIKNKNITYTMGVTSVLVNLLEKIVEYNNAEKVLDVLPNYSFAIFAGGSTRQYMDRFYEVVGRKIDVRECYLATEGSFAIQKSNKPVMEFLYDSCFYEFIPVSNNGPKNERLLINQLQKNKEYTLVITCYNGLYAYNIKDVIKVISTDPVTIKFAYREGVIDIADEKVTPSELYNSIEDACVNHTCEIINFCVVGVHEPKPHYIYLMEFKKKMTPDKPKKFLEKIDSNLQELNKVYYFNTAGPNSGAMIEPELWILNKGAFQKAEEVIMDESRNVGQTKIKRYSTDKKILGLFEDYIAKKIFLD